MHANNLDEIGQQYWSARWFMDVNVEMCKTELLPLIFPFIDNFRQQVQEIEAMGLAATRLSAVKVLSLMDYFAGEWFA